METNQIPSPPQNSNVPMPPAPVPTPPMPSAMPPLPPTPTVPSGSTNTGMAILAYLGILIVVPFLTDAKNDPFVKFHIKQGLVLIIAGFIFWLGASILSFIHLWFLTIFIYPVVSIGFFVLIIVGIINAASGKQKELPIIGQFARNFNF